jgi:NTE family protein
MSTAIVMSGGGIRGPLQVGALQSLLEHGIKPDMLAGTSAGSLNAGFMAAMGAELSTIPHLQDAWRSATKDKVYPGRLLSVLARVLDGAEGFFPGDGMRKLIEQKLPEGITTFGQCKLPCYLTAVDLRSARLFLFGEDPSAKLVDGMMASSLIPVLQPPLYYHDLQLVDGGLLAEVPCSVVMDKGATVIYAINVGRGEEIKPPAKGIFEIFMRTLDTMVAESIFVDLKRAENDPKVDLHHIHISELADLPFDDFNHIDEMFEVGKRVADAYLDNPQPRAIAPPAERAAVPLQTVPGARQYIPPHRQ